MFFFVFGFTGGPGLFAEVVDVPAVLRGAANTMFELSAGFAGTVSGMLCMDVSVSTTDIQDV